MYSISFSENYIPQSCSVRKYQRLREQKRPKRKREEDGCFYRDIIVTKDANVPNARTIIVRAHRSLGTKSRLVVGAVMGE